MTMEVLAAEFPDIFQQFIEIVPDPNKPEQLIYSENKMSMTSLHHNRWMMEALRLRLRLHWHPMMLPQR